MEGCSLEFRPPELQYRPFLEGLLHAESRDHRLRAVDRKRARTHSESSEATFRDPGNGLAAETDFATLQDRSGAWR